MTEEMLDYVEYQAKTGVAYLTIGNTPVVHTGSSAWLCELNVTEDRCIHGINQLVVRARAVSYTHLTLPTIGFG